VHLEVRGNLWMRNGKLIPRPQGMQLSPNFPGYREARLPERSNRDRCTLLPVLNAPLHKERSREPSTGCSGTTKHACTQLWATSVRSSSNSSGFKAPQPSQTDPALQMKTGHGKDGKQKTLPTFPQPRRLRTITNYGMRILRAMSEFPLLIRIRTE